MNNEWFIIKDLDGFINSSRALVFNNFGTKSEDSDSLSLQIDEVDKTELDSVLSFEESKVIVSDHIKKQKHKLNKDIRYTLNEKIFLDIITSLNDRMVSNILNSLVNKGFVETGYDEESNDFVFWVSDEYNKKEKPETD
jgi:hypothetical protein